MKSFLGLLNALHYFAIVPLDLGEFCISGEVDPFRRGHRCGSYWNRRLFMRYLYLDDSFSARRRDAHLFLRLQLWLGRNHIGFRGRVWPATGCVVACSEKRGEA